MFSFSKDFSDENSKLETLAEVEELRMTRRKKSERSFNELKIIILDKQKPIVWVFFTSADMNCNSGPRHNASCFVIQINIAMASRERMEIPFFALDEIREISTDRG